MTLLGGGWGGVLPDYFEDYILWDAGVLGGGGGAKPFQILKTSPFTPSIYIYYFFSSQILCFQEMLKQQNTDKLNRNGKLSPDYFIPNNFRKGWGK